jgi:hypothetical protein
MPATTADQTCLQCGAVARIAGARLCKRCGLPYGESPPASARLAECPVCYTTSADDGRFPSSHRPGSRVDINTHVDEHERLPVGDDEWLESLREHDRIRIGHWSAPFDLVRRYLVTGIIDAGRNRLAQHNSIVTAMTQIQRWGRDPDVFGDQEEWKAARDAVAELMDRYHAPRAQAAPRRRFW